MVCKRCNSLALKNGKRANGRQRYLCKSCRYSFQETYCYNAYNDNINKHIYSLLKESVGITATSRLLSISKTTVIKRLKMMAALVVKPDIVESHNYYELDEMRVVVGNKLNEAWITYAINRSTKQVVDFVVGRRTKRNLSQITQAVLKLNPRQIFTDGLRTYIMLIPKKLHNTRKKNTAVIERNNLTLRTHLKRLSRKTICFSKTIEMLDATLRLFFWGSSSHICQKLSTKL